MRYDVGDPRPHCDACWTAVDGDVRDHVCKEPMAYAVCDSDMRPVDFGDSHVVSKPRVTAHDLTEAGRFASFLGGEKAYSFTPRSRLARAARAVRWWLLGARLYFRVKLGRPFRKEGENVGKG